MLQTFHSCWQLCGTSSLVLPSYNLHIKSH